MRNHFPQLEPHPLQTCLHDCQPFHCMGNKPEKKLKMFGEKNTKSRKYAPANSSSTLGCHKCKEKRCD